MPPNYSGTHFLRKKLDNRLSGLFSQVFHFLSIISSKNLRFALVRSCEFTILSIFILVRSRSFCFTFVNNSDGRVVLVKFHDSMLNLGTKFLNLGLQSA